MYACSIALKNYTCFDEATVTFLYPSASKDTPPKDLANVNLILGDNGCGKTSLLKSISITALSKAISQSGFVPRNLVRRGQDDSSSLRAEFIADGNSDIFTDSEGHLDYRTDIHKYKTTEFLAPYTPIPSSLPKNYKGDDFELTLQLFTQEWSSIQNVFDEVALAKPDKKAQVETPLLELKKLHLKYQNTRAKLETVLNSLYDESSPAFFMLGYSATRRTDTSRNVDLQSQQKHRQLRYQRVAGLFEEHVVLVPLRAWLPHVDKERFDHVVSLVNDLLPEEAGFKGERESGEYLFEVYGGPVPFSALSDGYRGYVGLIGDMLYHLHSVIPEGPLTELAGIVMVDEIDLHLHPTWQRFVVPTLSRIFPRLQFLLTTHSPIVAGTLKAENIIVMEMERGKPDEEGHSWPVCVPKRYTEPIHGLNSDQILVSSYFGLDTTRAPDSERGRRDLLQTALDGDSEAALDFLKSLTGKSVEG